MITIDQQIVAVRREIAHRERIYPPMVETGRLKGNNAIYEIQVMKAVLRTLMTLRSLLGEHEE